MNVPLSTHTSGKTNVILKTTLHAQNETFISNPVKRASLHLSNKKTPGCLGYIRDYATQLCWDYNKPLESIRRIRIKQARFHGK